MNKLRSILFANRWFFGCYGLFFFAGLTLVLVQGKAGAFLLLNPYHRGPLDLFFTNYTYLGDGLFTLAVIVVLLIRRRHTAASQVLIAFLLSALVAQILKSALSLPRPREFFNQGQYEGPYTYFIQGVTLRGFSSFPSGHSTSIFALATMLAMLGSVKQWNWLYLLAAIAVGYSRIYLGQHFLNDVLAGSLTGVIVAVSVHCLFSERIGFWVDRRKRRKEGKGTG